MSGLSEFLAGVLSGLLGFGRAVVVVLALAVTASAAVVGAVTHVVQGEVDWMALLTLAAAGSVVGAPLGARLLRALALGRSRRSSCCSPACCPGSSELVARS